MVDTECSVNIRKTVISTAHLNRTVEVEKEFSKHKMTVSELAAIIKHRQQPHNFTAADHIEMSSDIEVNIKVFIKKGEKIEIKQV